MQPASSTGAERNRQLRRWGPIAAIVVVVAVVGIVVATRDSGGDSSSTTVASAAPDTTVAEATSVAPTESTAPATLLPQPVQRSHRRRSRFRCRLPKPPNRVSPRPSTGVHAATPREDDWPFPISSPSRATPRSPATTAELLHPGSPATRSRSSTTRGRKPTRSSPTSPMRSTSTTRMAISSRR